MTARPDRPEDLDVPTSYAALRLVSQPLPSQAWNEARDDPSVEMDAAYYADVRRAVGRGAPTVLLGTSTRSLKRSLAKLETARQGES
jgi:hypothetical protein